MHSKIPSRYLHPESGVNRIVGFFPGLGSRSAYRNLGTDLWECEFASVKAVYQEAAQALELERQPEKILLLPENMPVGKLERHGFIGAAFLVHNLALQAHLVAAAEQSNVTLDFLACTGESFGIIAAAVSSGAISCGDGAKIAQAFTPLMLLAADGGQVRDPFGQSLARYLPEALKNRKLVPEPFHVVALQGEQEDIAEALVAIEKYLKTDVQVHKIYSRQQTNVYVRAGVKSNFDLFLKNFPAVGIQALKEPTTFLAHSKCMHEVRGALQRFIEHNRIVISDPRIPVISNHGEGFLTTAQEVLDGILSVTDRVMTSRTTAEIVESLEPDLVLEFGLGQKSVRLLLDNGTTAPVTAYSGAADETRSLLSAVKLASKLQGEMKKLRTTESSLDFRHYDMLRELFLLASASPAQEKYLYRTVINVVTKEMLRPKRDRSSAFYQFLETFQHTFRHRTSIDVDNGELILQARLKKNLFADQEPLGNVYAELKVLNRNGGVADTRLLDSIHAPEVVIFYFEGLDGVSLTELSKNTRSLLATQPLAREIYGQLLQQLQPEGGDLFMPKGMDILSPYQIAVQHVFYQYTLFRLIRIHRPAIFAQRDCYAKGSDPMSWLVALAVSEACSLPDVLRFYEVHLRAGSGTQEVKTALAGMCAAFQVPVVPVISPEGMLLQSATELEAATLSVFMPGRSEDALCSIQVNANCHIVSLGSVLKPGRVSAGAHKTSIIPVPFPADIWKKFSNPALDELEEICISTLTDDNERVLRYAQSRRLFASTIYAYVNMGERIVGFGKGGSESMTMFLALEADDRIIVRKVLSEALTAARWDPKGKGVMLPPFAKAKKQAEYLQSLPESVRPFFPEVYRIQERDLPIPLQLQKNGKAIHQEVIYEMSYLPGEEVSRYVEKYMPPPAVIACLYEQIYRFLKHHVHSVGRVPAPGNTLEAAYFKKIEDRLDLCRRTAPRTFGKELLDAEHVVINGIPYHNLLAIVQRFRRHAEFLDILEPRFHSLVMGDTNTENVKITNIEPLLHAQRLIEAGATAAEIDEALDGITLTSLGIRFLDPRAIGFNSEGSNTRDDAMYDNKPWHNCLGHYDEIHYEHFKLQVQTSEGQTPRIDVAFNEDNPFRRAYKVRDVEEKGGKIDRKAVPKGMEDYFAPVMTALYGQATGTQAPADDPYWLIRFVFVMGTHFAAMPPFHFVTELNGALIDNYEMQRRPVAIYCEGVKWLNWALQMLEGKRKEFLGVQVPPLPYLGVNDAGGLPRSRRMVAMA